MPNHSLIDVRVFAPRDFRRWVIGGVALNLMAYAAMLALGWWEFGYRGITSNLVATVACAVALGLALRSHEVAGASLAVFASWGELLYGFATTESFPEAGLIVTPVLIVASGLLVGTRRAAVFTMATILGTIVAFRVSPSAQPDGLSQTAVYWLGLHTVVSVGAWALLGLSLRGFGRLLRELTEHQRELADTIRSSPDGILVVDRQDTVLLGNPAAQGVLGVHEGQLVGRRVADVLTAALGATDSEAVMSRPAAGGPLALSVTRADAVTVHLEAAWRSMEGGRRQLVLHDVTDRVRAEARRREMEGQLAHAQRLEAVGQLAGGLSHDFNNILTAVGGSADLLRDELRPLERTALIDEIVAARDRGAALTRQLLAFARRDVVQPRVLDLAAQVRAAERLLQRVASERVHLHFSLTPGCTVRCDLGQLEQVLVNLVSNARDAMPRGGQCMISVAREFDAAGNAWVRLAVTDQGVGMAPDVLARAFEPFFTTKPRGQGTGLGLASVHGLATQCGGRAFIESVPRTGTTVSLELPHVAEPAEPVEVADPKAPDPVRQSTILVAEDDQGTRTIVERILRHAGHAVVTARDGAEALAIIEAGEVAVDLLLTDVMMPRLTGPALAARVRVVLPQLPVLFMTGYAEDTVRDLGDVRFDRDVIVKPFSGNALTDRVHELLRLSEAADARVQGQEHR